MNDSSSKILLKISSIFWVMVFVIFFGFIYINPVQADTENNVVELSTDGLTYTSSITDLFGPVTLVPLSDTEASFWVRNSGPTDAYLSIALVKVEVTNAVAAHSLNISASTNDQAGTYYPLDTENECLNINSGKILAPGEATIINTNLWMNDVENQEGQNVPVGFSLLVILSGGVPSSAGQPCSFSPEPNPVPVPTEPTPPSPSNTHSSSKDSTSSHSANQNYKGNNLARTGASTLIILLAASAIMVSGVITITYLRKKNQTRTIE